MTANTYKPEQITALYARLSQEDALDGDSNSIVNQKKIQEELWEEYFKNKKCLRICLEIPSPTDYMKIVSYYAGDC